ncbi:helix-turn-helix domain-containing protein [Pedobacter insulae]|uniref:Transcriptional regulator, contains XRE-family HTH domain n=1 Tax=Pedobacter insulae TaxID=414048 RepID=A0A1I2ZYE0_9SPHI|nr:helix-turn-helix transcriptional regulator [Pedobacter insulae]SFH42675.1 Transcriptional regulator, contains XRE-family HTH domain [Pedobacter insulae]
MKEINFGENLRRIRNMKEVSQNYVASKIGMNQSTYSKMENSPLIPNAEIVKASAAALQTTVDELLSDDLRLLDIAEKHKAKVDIYSIIAILFAIGAGIICANPTWTVLTAFCEKVGITGIFGRTISVIGGFVPLILFVKAARKITKRYAAIIGS